MILESIVARSVGVAPLRLALAAALFVLARVAGAPASAWIAFALGVAGGFFVVGTDPRRKLMRREVEEEPPPPEARVARGVDVAVRALYPSSVGVAALAAVALVFEPTLASLLAGVVGGMGVVGLVTGLQFVGRGLYRERGGVRVYATRQ